ALEEVAMINSRRSLILVISDFLTHPSKWETELGHLAAMRHDIRAIQVLDPAEKSLEFGNAAQWEDMETGQRLYIDPEVARKEYLKKFSAHQNAVKQSLDERGISFQSITTDTPLDFVLLELIKRSGVVRTAARVNPGRTA
ncbi:MAG: DUF58 domain-containing protein, partial [Verrucomicrobiae bacterium]|nr:DUF58 domain-containing protein [Verrucomicrobiae bacterium]